MNTTKWGPGAWVFLHTITFNYPLDPNTKDEDEELTKREVYSNYFKFAQKILPCKYCRKSYKVYIKFLPIDPFLDDREGVTYWLYRLHDLINKKLFKTSPSFEFVCRKYEEIRAKCSKMTKDGDAKKKFDTCQIKVVTEDDEIKKFAQRAIDKYETMADEMIEKLYKSPDNPNKHCLEYEKNKQTKSNYVQIKYYPINYELSQEYEKELQKRYSEEDQQNEE